MTRLGRSVCLLLALHALACEGRIGSAVDAGATPAPDTRSDADASSDAPGASAWSFDDDAGADTSGATFMDAGTTDEQASARDAASDEDPPTVDAADAGPLDVPHPDPSVYRGACEIGIVNPQAQACFQPHDPAIAIPLVGANQGDLLIELALRARDARGGVADFVVTAKESGRTTRARVTAKELDCGRDLVCGDLADDRWCKSVPVWIISWGLVDDPYDLMNLAVTVEMTLRDADGPLCTTSIEGFLYRF